MLSKEKLQEVIQAKEEIVKGSLTIWNVRLETLIQIGDRHGVLEAMRKPAEIAEINGSCNVGCNSCGGSGGSGNW